MGKQERVRLDCRGRQCREVIAELLPLLRRRASDGARVVIVVENVLSLRDSVARFYKDLIRRVLAAGVRATVVDRSGCGGAFLEAIGGPVPLVACAAPRDAPAPRRLLIVEDNDDSREFLKETVESAGHACDTAATAAAALRLLKERDYDFVILDLVLPDADGTAVARHLLDAKKRVPVIVVSAFLDRWDEATYRKLKIRRRFAKPFRVKDLLGAIR